MKPFVLAQALNAGISVNSVYPGRRELIVDGEDFNNYGDTHYGMLNLRDATRLSVNTIYVQLMQAVGPDRVAKFAKAHGLEAELDGRAGTDRDPRPLEAPPLLKPVLSQSLGSGSVTTLQLASAFGTWANRGVHQTPHLVEKVVDSQGRVLEDNTRQQGPQVIAQVHADTINMVLKGAVENGTGTAARLFGREVAGKTGTTSDYTDARFVGYTPNLVTSVWLGFDNNEAQAAQRARPVRGVRRVAAGPDLARLHGPGHPQPARRVVRAPGRPRRPGAEPDHHGPADDRAAQPTQPGNPGQPPADHAVAHPARPVAAAAP